jgi:hypothetical protein
MKNAWQEQLFHRQYASSTPPIVRRIGEPPSHLNCECPKSWTLVVAPRPEGTEVGFVVEVEPQNLSNEEREDITRQVKGIEGSGGLADYEDFGIVKGRGDLMRSMAAACMQAGVMLLPNGDIQPPLFPMINPMVPLRWDLFFD